MFQALGSSKIELPDSAQLNMAHELRRKVLGCFKQLHRTRLTVFHGDTNALAGEARAMCTRSLSIHHEPSLLSSLDT
ncbi:hypothetical protein E2C01_057923 [Portunus trituberculatus]|uniref:Uncharacterized protein n=1 Tax=Portunus trituberculatus TaxID=210409 RepID=A0A5B7H3A1_PORTR|nr:hypothetical protein [Portunus trituberculatus]